ncbi:MAG: pyrimidine dimer DNA glycosylase/endonuclease V [Deltaproteobacteria bacterium]|nr:pyrimidine dimer DNA glycosylase/endonuclease V [Deltaproteobacteria bacterium]
MRIWDIDPQHLCRQHLLGEHRELHGLWNILTIHHGEKGYSRHPETLRWRGKLRALYLRHQELVREMQKRGYQHLSDLDACLAQGSDKQDIFIDLPAKQKEILQNKPCPCFCQDKNQR